MWPQLSMSGSVPGPFGILIADIAVGALLGLGAVCGMGYGALLIAHTLGSRSNVTVRLPHSMHFASLMRTLTACACCEAVLIGIERVSVTPWRVKLDHCGVSNPTVPSRSRVPVLKVDLAPLTRH